MTDKRKLVLDDAQTFLMSTSKMDTPVAHNIMRYRGLVVALLKIAEETPDDAAMLAALKKAYWDGRAGLGDPSGEEIDDRVRNILEHMKSKIGWVKT